MNELLPPDGEKNNAESVALFDELTTMPEWSALCQAVVELEGSAILYERDEPDERIESLQQAAIELGALIGYEYHGEACHVVGLAYEESAEGDKAPEPVVLSTSQGTFLGCTMQYIDGRWRVLLEVAVLISDEDLPSPSDDEGYVDELMKAYYIHPDRHNLMSLRVSPGNDIDDESDAELLNPDTVEYLHTMANDAIARIAQSDFSNLPVVDQRAILDDYLDSIDANFPRELRSGQILIDCTGYYTGYADMLGMVFKDYTDWSDEVWQGSNQRLLKGDVVGFTYLELEGISANQRVTSASFVHDGAPYVILSTDNPNVMHYVPLSTIRDLV